MIALFFQAVRFLGIGFLNTAVDFAVLNFFSSTFQIYRGFELGLLNALSFSTAVLHSFFWNKFWTFASGEEKGILQNVGKFLAAASLGIAVLLAVLWGAKQEFGFSYFVGVIAVLLIGEFLLLKTFRLAVPVSPESAQRQFLLFIVVSIVGAAINSGIVAGVTARVDPILGLNKELWLNVVKAFATGIAMVWNFLGYKLVVFKK